MEMFYPCTDRSGLLPSLRYPSVHNPISLMSCIKASNYVGIHTLIAAHADIEQIEEQTGDTPLIKATKFDNHTAMEMLLIAGAKVNGINRQTGNTAITQASTSKSRKLLKMWGASLSTSIGVAEWIRAHQPISPHLTFENIVAISQQRPNAFCRQEDGNHCGANLQLSQRAHQWEQTHPPENLHTSSIPPFWVYKWVYNYMSIHPDIPVEWDFPLLSEFLELCIQMHSTNKPQQNQRDLILQMLEKGDVLVKPNRKQRTTLTEAARRNRHKMVKMLLDVGADINERSGVNLSTALMWGAAHGHIHTLDVLLAASADKEVRDQDELTALMYALLNGELDSFKRLIEAGADIEACNHAGENLFEMAIQFDMGPFIDVLLEAKADPNRVNTQTGNTPLLTATTDITRAAILIIQTLLKAGAHVNTPNPKNGNTPLLHATLERNPEAMKILLAAGATPNTINHEGNIPIFCTEEDTPLRWILTQAGASVQDSKLVALGLFDKEWNPEMTFEALLASVSLSETSSNTDTDELNV